jgi:hypothetical protein
MTQDHEREHLKDLLFIHADRLEEEKRIMDEINEEEHKRLPAKIYVFKTTFQPTVKDESKNNTLPFRGAD